MKKQFFSGKRSGSAFFHPCEGIWPVGLHEVSRNFNAYAAGSDGNFMAAFLASSGNFASEVSKPFQAQHSLDSLTTASYHLKPYVQGTQLSSKKSTHAASTSSNGVAWKPYTWRSSWCHGSPDMGPMPSYAFLCLPVLMAWGCLYGSKSIPDLFHTSRIWISSVAFFAFSQLKGQGLSTLGR